VRFSPAQVRVIEMAIPSPSTPPPAPRRRGTVVLLLAVVVTLGLASRLLFPGYPRLITKDAGDALWAIMFYLLVSLAGPRLAIAPVVAIAFAITAGIEFFKLHRAPWIDAVRDVKVMSFLLGRVFGWHNFIAYAIGTAAAVVIDLALLRNTRR